MRRGFPFRTVLPPREVTARAELRRGESVLAAASYDDPAPGGWLLGTRDALVVLPAEGAPTRLVWESVLHAGWDVEQGRLTVSEVGRFGEPRPVHTFGLESPDRLLQLVRERVSASVVMQRRVPVADRDGGLTVMARRPPSGGEIEWYVDFDPTLDPTDPVVRDLAARALDAARAELPD